MPLLPPEPGVDLRVLGSFVHVRAEEWLGVSVWERQREWIQPSPQCSLRHWRQCIPLGKDTDDTMTFFFCGVAVGTNKIRKWKSALAVSRIFLLAAAWPWSSYSISRLCFLHRTGQGHTLPLSQRDGRPKSLYTEVLSTKAPNGLTPGLPCFVFWGKKLRESIGKPAVNKII